MKIFVLSKKLIYFIFAIVLLLILSLFLFLRYNKANEVFKMEPYYQGTKDDKSVAFACNIDWGNEYIDDLLEILKKNNIKITFFPTGRWSENNKDILLKIYENGHEIGNHGYKHLDYDKLDYERNYEEISKAHLVIEGIIDDTPIYFSPPSGSFNENTVKAAYDLGYKMILWSVDTIDWRKDSYKEIIVQRVTEKIHNSAIVLMHPTAETNKALPDIINNLFQKGYKIGTISDII